MRETGDLAEQAAEVLGEDAEALRVRWDGRPERIAEDIFRAVDLETYELQPLGLYEPYQPQLLRAYFFADCDTINVYKGRRIGVSFVFCIAILIDALTTPGAFFPIVSVTKGQAENRIEDIYTLVDNWKLPMTRDDFEKDNVDEIVLPNGATIGAFSGDPDTSRGDDSAKTLFIDEMAWLEDQKAALAALQPFVGLGNTLSLHVSTPKVSNDEFLQEYRRGDPRGESGVLSIQQPSFANADEIDIQVPLTDQHVVPVRPDMNIGQIEQLRASDPQGFAQEYLCRPISDEYRFFAERKVVDAQERGEHPEYEWSPYSIAGPNSEMVMAVDIAISSDDTAVSVWEHKGEQRNLRYHEIVTNQVLREAGIGPDPDRGNPRDLVRRLQQINDQMGVDYMVYDDTGVGSAFRSDIRRLLGRRAHRFNFSDKDKVAEMMGNFNYGLHNDLITLVDDEKIYDQLTSIVKIQKEDHQKPKFTGKEHAPEGKDDLAISLVLGAYPPGMDASRSMSMHSKDEAWSDGTEPSVRPEGTVDTDRAMTAQMVNPRRRIKEAEEDAVTRMFGTPSRQGRSRKRTYNRRYRR